MKFNEFVTNENQRIQDKVNRELNIHSRSLSLLGCGSHKLGRVEALAPALDYYEPELYLYMSFGFTFYFSFGDRGKSFGGYKSYAAYQKDSAYKIAENLSYGFRHRFHLAPYAFIDLSALTRTSRFHELLKKGEGTLVQYYNLMRNHLGDETYISNLNQAYHEEIDKLAAQAQQECHFAPVTTMAEIFEQARLVCQTKKRNSFFVARRLFAGEEIAQPPKKIPLRLIGTLALSFALLALLALLIIFIIT